MLFAYRSDPRVSRLQGWAPADVAEAVAFIDRQHTAIWDTPDTWYQLGVRRHDSAELIGDIGVHFCAGPPGAPAQQVELGFTISPQWQRQGFGTEAVVAVLQHLLGDMGKHRVFASVDPRNAASVALLQRAGMRQEAYFRRSLWLNGEWVDDVIFALLAVELARSRGPS